ncbi:sensor histidine kinase [Streptomyces sp. NPDC057616]|uniref:sensor histidine kinase n=1 Tax=Streptomyces sp. NPDC057616 TaxID=3346183 RepID=UPI0036CCB4AD
MTERTRPRPVATEEGPGREQVPADPPGRRHRARTAAEALLALSLVGAATAVHALSRPATGAAVSLALAVAAAGVPTVAAWILGCRARARRTLAARTRERAHAQEQQEERTRAVLAAERARIARELHDIVAHNVSLIVIQAAAADRALERDPGRIPELHATIEQTGRATVVELRGLLGRLRTEEESGAEQHRERGIADIPYLLDAVRDAGMDVRWSSAGTPRRVPAGTGLAAYRIVQEALTNSLKHAGLTRAAVVLDWQDGRLTVTVRDDGPLCGGDGRPPCDAEAPVLPGGGSHGLVGMRERVAAVGGSLHTGPCPEGGFAVRAVLPLDTAAS